MVVTPVPEDRDPARPLGRHVEHDPRSRAFRVVVAPAAVELRPVLHRRHGRILRQDVGSCTGEALTGNLMTDPVYRPRRNYGQRTAMRLYKRATVVDEFPGEYPPDDTGSSGLAVCKAGVELGYLSEYRWAFGIDDALAALQQQAVITGTVWRSGMDFPDGNGLVKITGHVRGGHEYLVRGFDPDGPSGEPEVWCDNSWGDDWGFHGSFRLRVLDWAELLEDYGDVTEPVRA